MTKIVKETTVEASPEIIWTMIVKHLEHPEIEVARGPEWDELVIKDLKGEALTPNRSGIGVRTRWHYKFYWYKFSWDDEVVELEEKRRITWKSISTWDMVDSFILIPMSDGTRLVYEMDYTTPYGVLGKILYRIFVNKHLERHLEYTLLQMKRNAEKIQKLTRPRKRT